MNHPCKLSLAGGFAVLAILPAFAQNAPPPVIDRTIKSYDGASITLAAADGSVVTAKMTSDTMIILRLKRSLGDIKPGDFISLISTSSPDGKVHASEIRIFNKTADREGQFAMSPSSQTMTNGMVGQVVTGVPGAPVVKLTFHGAGAPGAAGCTGKSSDAPGGAGKGCVGDITADVPAGTPIFTQVYGATTDLKSGAKASLDVTPAASGPVASRVMIAP